MHRKLLIIATVVLVLAVGSVGLVAYQQLLSGNNGDQRQAEVPQSTEPELQQEPQVEPAPIVPARKVETPPPGLVKEGATELAEMMAFEEEPEAEAPEETKDRIHQLLASLTPEEKKELNNQLMRERQRKHREQRRYNLRTQAFLNSLRWQRDANMKLTLLQQEQIKSVLESMKPRIKMSLADNWTREEELRKQMGELSRQGRRNEATPLNEELRTLQRGTGEVKKQFDDEFRLQLHDILTPEQNQWLNKRTGRQSYGLQIHRR